MILLEKDRPVHERGFAFLDYLAIKKKLISPIAIDKEEFEQETGLTLSEEEWIEVVEKTNNLYSQIFKESIFSFYRGKNK